MLQFVQMQKDFPDRKAVEQALWFALKDGWQNQEIAAAIGVQPQQLSGFKSGKGYWSERNHEALKMWLVANGYKIEGNDRIAGPEQARDLAQFAGQQLVGLGEMLLHLDEPLDFRLSLLEDGMKRIQAKILPKLKEKVKAQARQTKGD